MHALQSRPSPAKIDAIEAMKEMCYSQSKVRRFLGACTFYHIWILHYAHITDPFYHMLRKGKTFEWRSEHTKAMKKLKKALRRAEVLKKPNYDRSIIVTVDTSVEYECIMAIFTLSLWTTQVWAISINSVKGSCPKTITI